MAHDRLRPIGLVLAAATIGRIGWSGEPLLLPCALLFPLLWGYAPTRLLALWISASYFLAASSGLPISVANFYGVEEYKGLSLWLGSAACFALVHSCCWSRHSPTRRVIGFATATFLMIVPPFGIVGWANPLNAAGILFPGWGWLGLALTMSGMVNFLTKIRSVIAIALTFLWITSVLNWTSSSVPQSWIGVDTNFHKALGRGFDLSQQWHLIHTMQAAANRSRANVIVAPESAAGYWTTTTQALWRQAAINMGTTLVVGAAVVREIGYDNVMIAIEKTGAATIYRQRMPVPVAMWQPWLLGFGQRGGASAGFFNNPVVMIGQQRTAILLCYEQLITWPILHSMMHRPDILVATGNGWWTEGTSIVGIQRANAIAWAKLFDLPLVLSFNT